MTKSKWFALFVALAMVLAACGDDEGADTTEAPGDGTAAPGECDGEMIIACVQCKFVQKSTNWAKIKDKMLTAVKGLRENHVKFFPVVYTTADQRTMMESTFGDGVYFEESDLYDFTKRLGILRMHTLKLGASLLTSHPYLRIAEE